MSGAPGGSDEERLKTTLGQLNEQQKTIYDRRMMLAEDRELEITTDYRLAVATTLAKDMPDRHTRDELGDHLRRETVRQHEQHIRQDAQQKEDRRQPGANRTDGEARTAITATTEDRSASLDQPSDDFTRAAAEVTRNTGHAAGRGGRSLP